MKSYLWLLLPTLAVSSPLLDVRQSTTWVDTCKPGSNPPADFKAFDVGGCQSQLSYTADKNHIAIQFTFEAVYADGSRVEHKPFRDYQRLAVSDTFYRQDQGLNWILSSSQSRQYTSVHEFTNTCKNGVAPVAWYFLASSSSTVCQPKGYKYTSPRIAVAKGTRPANTRASGRRVDDNGNFEITWNPVSNAVAYTVILKFPSGSDEVGNPYSSTIGSRLSSSTTRSTYLAARSGNRWAGRERIVVVNSVNAQGVWNLTPDNANVVVPW